MIEGRINLYSDTQSRPTMAMREAIMNAPVGDEQKGLDKSVNQLCDYVANLLGMEAALFMPSGTMCNEIAVLVHCRPGDEIYADQTAHLLGSEAGGPAAFAGATIFPLQGDRGIYSAEILAEAIRRETRYTPRPALVEVEQTSNLGGGRIWPLETIRSVVAVAKERGLKLHLDGARLMNAVAETGIAASDYTAGFDTAWVDLSKGLGCPFGGVLAGSQQFVDEAWRWKQRMGGAMRQAGMMAAAGLYAFEHHVERLKDDHDNARRLAQIVQAHELVEVVPAESNILMIDIPKSGILAQDMMMELERSGINIGAFGPFRLRAVTHLDVSAEQIEEAGQAILATLDRLREAA